ncbi:MAG TPA: HAD family hydrolase [Verrucomicrobiae bacterium]|nr:HAD family hydrolase [Verrucomicrobiae bacterium]
MNKNGFKVKGIFLDFDGTIVDSKEAYIEAAKIAFQACGQKLPGKKAAFEIPRRLEKGLTISDIVNGDSKKFLRVYFETYYSITREKTKLIPNVSATLENLSAKTKLALITMRYVPKQTVIKELECFGISKYFSHVVTALDTSKPKPSPESLIACVRALDVEVCDCIIAGDSVNDVRAGKAAGVRTAAVLSGLFQCEELSKECPDLILDDVNELPKFIK